MQHKMNILQLFGGSFYQGSELFALVLDDLAKLHDQISKAIDPLREVFRHFTRADLRLPLHLRLRELFNLRHETFDLNFGSFGIVKLNFKSF